MHKLLSCFLVVLLMIFMSLSVRADVVELDNGSKLVGQIQKVVNGTLSIKTDFAGDLTIPLARVVLFSSDTPLFVALASENRLYGTIQYSRKQTRVETPDGTVRVEAAGPVAVWQKEMEDPLLPVGRKWKYEVGIDIAGKTGNSERFSSGGKIKTTLQGPEDKLLFYLSGMFAKENGKKTDDKIKGGVDFERIFAERHSWYARIELEKDDIEDISLRSTAAGGYGYYFLKNADHELRARAGILYRHESYVDTESESTMGLDFGIYHMYQFAEWAKLLTDITYTPSVETFSDYLIHHETVLEVPLGLSDIWKLQMGVTNDYKSPTPDEKVHLDTSYFSRLAVSWQ